MPYAFCGYVCQECGSNNWSFLGDSLCSYKCNKCGNTIDRMRVNIPVRKMVERENKEDDMPNIFKCDECGEIIRRKEKILVQLHVERPKSQDENYETIPEVSVSSFRDLCGKCYDAFVGNWPYPCRPEGDDE